MTATEWYDAVDALCIDSTGAGIAAYAEPEEITRAFEEGLTPEHYLRVVFGL